MKYLRLMFVVAFSLCYLREVVSNDFSSFFSDNASLAVVVDQEYMTIREENILANFRKILGDIIREHLKNGGINVKYFSWIPEHLKRDFIAAITVASCKNTWKFFESTRQSSTLLISITDANCPRLPINCAIMIPIVSRGDEFPQMILDANAQEILNWKSGLLLVDQSIINDNALLAESVVHENSKNQIPLISLYLYQVDDNLRSQNKRTAIRKTLESFSKSKHSPNQFIVFSKFYEDIIEVAGLLNMFHIYNQWLFFVVDETKKENFHPEIITLNLDEGANIAFVINTTDLNCQDNLNCTLSEVSMAFVTSLSRMIVEERSIYGEISDEEWESIRFTTQQRQDEILRYMKNYLRENSKCSSCSRWELQTALTWGKSQEHKKNSLRALREARNKYFEFVGVGYWSPLLGYNSNEFLFPHIKKKFCNITMDIITIHNPPWQILSKNSKNDIISHSGIVMEILKELSKALNFTYHLQEARSGEEEEVPNENIIIGSQTYLIPYHLIEMVQGSRFFLAAVAATIEDPDSKAFNYTIPISIQKYTFIARKPDEISRIYLFTAPFTLETWGSLFCVILIVAPVLCIVNYLVPIEDLQTNGLCNMKNCFWYIYGALLQQGGMYLPKADSGRMVVGIWWIVVIVLITTYCGNLVAFLTFPKFQPGMEYLFQLFQHNGIEKFALRNNTFFQKHFMTTTRDDIRRYLNLAIAYNNTDGADIDAVGRGDSVNIDWRINLQLIIQRHFEKDKDCKFILGKENFVDEQIALIMPTNSPYMQLVNNEITRLFHMGFIERWHKTNLPSMDKCNGRGVLRQITNHKVNLIDMQGSFFVLLIGFTIAVFVVFLEYWCFRIYLAKRQAKKQFLI